MNDRPTRKPDFTRRLLLFVAVLLIVAATAVFGPVRITHVGAQATAQNPPQIRVGSGGPKMTKTTSAENDPSAFFFRALGDLTVRNQSMKDFATWMQSGVMDKPVVDETELKDKYDLQLKWTPDESQFAQFRGTGAVVPPPSDDPKAPPNLYTAMQEQLGLKMGPAKFPDDVIVIDHVEKPSEN
jgi:uncharacterized protein (TIGR03435 family)